MALEFPTNPLRRLTIKYVGLPGELLCRLDEKRKALPTFTSWPGSGMIYIERVLVHQKDFPKIPDSKSIPSNILLQIQEFARGFEHLKLHQPSFQCLRPI
jgi:hypothetical protein